MSRTKETARYLHSNEPLKESEMARESEGKRLPRREMLRGAALGAAGVAAGALGRTAAAQDASAASGVPEKWDKEADVVVIGSGTGLAGALAAAIAGDEVIVLEKMARAGGSMGISGGVIYVPLSSAQEELGVGESREDVIAYMTMCAEGQSTPEMIETYVDTGPEMLDFLLANSPLKVDAVSCDYHSAWSTSGIGRTVSPVREDPSKSPTKMYEFGGGWQLAKDLLAGVEAAGVEVLLETPAKRLITRMLPDGIQEVLGVVAESGGEQINIKARKGVLLAAGGFDWDFELKKHFLRGPTPYATGVPGNTGDGLRMAMAVGADLRNMNECWGMPVYAEQARIANAQGEPSRLDLFSDYRLPAGMIFVNRFGERFCNEAVDYDTIWRSFFTWDNWGEPPGYRNIPYYLIADQAFKDKFMGRANPAKDPLPEWVKQADTLEELAAALEIDPDGLAATVAEFNAYARKGEDPKFGRGECQWLFCGLGGAKPLQPLVTPPFYGIECGVGDIGTVGGPRVNTDAQVLNPFDQVIPRLYCAGNNSGIGAPGAGYAACGATLGAGLIFSYRAANHMVGLEPWE